MKLAYSLRFRLTIFYLFIVLGPMLIMTIAMSYYYQTSIAWETQILTEGTLTSLARNLERFPVFPLFSSEKKRTDRSSDSVAILFTVPK